MKPYLGLLGLVVIGLAAWMFYPGSTDLPESEAQSGEVAPQTTEETTTEAEEIEETTTEAVETAEEAVEELKEEAETVVEDLKEEAEAVADAVETDVKEAAAEAEDKIKEALGGVAGNVEEAVTGGSNDVKKALENALGGSTDQPVLGGGEASEADQSANLEHDAEPQVDPDALSEALSVETFDGLAIREALAGSDLDAITKTSIESLITVGENNPDQLQDVIGKIRELMGL